MTSSASGDGKEPLALGALVDALDAFADVALDVNALLEAVAQRAAALLGDASTVTLLSEDGAWLRNAAMCLQDPALEREYLAMLEAAPARVGEGRAGHVMTQNAALLVSEVNPETLVAGSRPEWRDVVRRLNIHSLLVVPMRVRGVPIGAFSLLRTGPGRPYGKTEEALLQGLADRAAVAVANARLHAGLKQRLTEAEQESLERDQLRKLFDGMPQLGWTAQPDGFIDYYNRGWYEYTGTTFRDMEGWGWQSVHDPALLPLVMERWKESIAKGTPFDMAFRLRRHDGVFRWFLTRVNPMRDATGKVVRWVGINADIDDQKRLEEQLQTAREESDFQRDRFRSLLDHLPVTVSFLHGDNLVVEYAHPNTVRALGGRQIEGRPLLEAVPEHRGQPFIDRLREVIATGRVYEQREVFVPIDRTNTGNVEESYWTSLYQPLRRRDGSIEGVMTFDQEVTTEKKRTEDKLRVLEMENQVLAEKARMQEFQERFLAILGHDLRNPLSAIDMAAAFIRQRAAKTNDGAVRDLAVRIGSSTRRMTRMIEQILDLTRSRLAGGLAISPAPMDLRDTLAAVVDELRTAHPSREIELRSPPLPGKWDSDRLEQVFSNLIGNAITYGEEKAVTIRASVEATEVRVDVHNEGVPIAEDLLSKLFTPFRRGTRDSRTAKTVGLGLGLYISHEIVVAHGGRIDAESSSTEGTTFHVRLPRSTSVLQSQ